MTDGANDGVQAIALSVRAVFLDANIACVHDTFMSDTLTIGWPKQADPLPDRAHDAGGSGRVLVLVRALIVFGQQLLEALRQPDPDPSLMTGFGPLTLASIVARVMRGLQIAAALHERLLQPRRKRDAAAVHAPVVRERKPREAGGRTTRMCDDDRMPTAEEIAVMLRQRPLGAVLADICRDLGIGLDFPLWRELSDAIIETGGDIVKLSMESIERQFYGTYRGIDPGKALPLELMSPSFVRAATGPPGLRTAA